ncbi:MAG: magnetochrome domain-containing protein [Candidatus Omnitrophica bacterium]|nr:magnetochrome domain-containing protein [Candidatus Omnitrophota bacterium]
MVIRTHIKKHTPTFEEISTKVKNADLNTYFIFGAIIIVLITGVYALFAPESSNPVVGNPACGKIVVATNGPSLASKVSATLPEASYFLVVNPLSKRLVESIQNPYRGKVPNPQIAYLIAGKGEEAVIVGSIDQQSYNIFNQFSIRVFGGYQGQAKKVVSLYRKARIGQMARPTPTTVNVLPGAQMGQGHAQVAFGQARFNYACPRCGQAATSQNYNGVGCPVCPNCAIQMTQRDITQQTMILGQQNRQGMRVNQPYCPLPNVMDGGLLQNGMGLQAGAPQQQVGTQGGVQAGVAIQEVYAKGVMDGLSMRNNFNGGMQAAFGFGPQKQAFVCPVCNWRMKAERQGNNFPACPNCGSPMALDMSKQNQEAATPLAEGLFAANTVPMNQQVNPINNQVNNQLQVFPGREITQGFQCPNCNWRIYSKQGANDFPQCPNCGQIMARAGKNFQTQNTQNGVFANQVALQQNYQTAPAQGNVNAAPPISPDAPMPHEYRGECSNCHQFLSPAAGQVQNNAVADQGVAHVGIGNNK